MQVAQLNYGELVFAVVPLRGDGSLLSPMIYGTAFCIGPGIFVTAGHVIDHILEDGGKVGVGRIADSGGGVAPALKVEVLSFDVGVILAHAAGPALMAWDTEPRSLLHDVAAVGFPFAVNAEGEGESRGFKVTMRGFKGHVQTRTKLWSKPGNPVGYEVSTLFPKGMSGAPLLNDGRPVPELQLVGMVLGNSEVTAFEETTRFGIALDVQELARVNSPGIVGGTLGQLREKYAAHDDFKFTPSRPFLEWEHR